MDSPTGPVPPEDAETVPLTSAVPDRRALVTQGLVWTGMLHLFLVGVNFVSMLILVRLLSPAEYGRATAATGILALINCFNCSYFMAQALQLHEGQEPDWEAHWSAGFYLQFALFIVCNMIAVGCWMLPAYRGVAGLLHVASVGLLLDCPNQLGLVRLRRELNYRSLRLVQAASVLVTFASSVALAAWGAGAFALVVGSNVLHGLPQGFYLLFIRKWRPRSGWWRWPFSARYRQPLRFGVQLSGSAVLAATRGMLEASVLPATLGYELLGLLNRAQVLFSTTAGRVTALLVDTVYPLLPRNAADPKQFARHATLFVQTLLLVTITGAVFVSFEGPQLSRLLYGSRWVAADPLILPGTVFAWAVSTALIFATVLQAQNRLRLTFLSSLIGAALCLPAILAVLMGASVLTYAWVAAAGQLVAATVVAILARGSLQKDWFATAVLPPVLCAGLGLAMLVVLRAWARHWPLAVEICFNAGLFAAVIVLVMRIFFRRQLAEFVNRLPGSNVIAAVFGL